MPLKAYRPPEDPGLWDTYLEWLERALKVAEAHPTTLAVSYTHLTLPTKA